MSDEKKESVGVGFVIVSLLTALFIGLGAFGVTMINGLPTNQIIGWSCVGIAAGAFVPTVIWLFLS